MPQPDALVTDGRQPIAVIDATFTALQVAGSDLGRSVVMLFSDGSVVTSTS